MWLGALYTLYKMYVERRREQTTEPLVGTAELRDHLAEWIERALRGDVVTITRAGRPSVYLVARPLDHGDRVETPAAAVSPVPAPPKEAQ
jgi:prevent-host-death family protein